MDAGANEPLFAGIYVHHGGVKMRESSLAQGREVTKDYIIENVSSSGSPSFPGSESDLSLAHSSVTTQHPSSSLSLPSDVPNHLNDFACVGFTVGHHPPPTEPYINVCSNDSRASDESSEVFLTNGVQQVDESESPTSVVSRNFYEDIQLLRQQNQSSDELRDHDDSPVGFDREIDSSELDSLSSPSENFLYAEIEKSLDSSRDDLITESIEMEPVPNKRKSSRPRQMPTDEGNGLEVSVILKDLDKGGASVDPEGMLVGYGPRKSNDEVDEGLAGSESLPSTPSGYHSYTTEATLPKHLLAQPEQNAEAAEAPAVSRLQRMDALDDESIEANGSETDVVVSQPLALPDSPVLFNCIPPGLDVLLESGQLVVHMGSLRHDTVIDPGCRKRMEIIDETRKVLFYAEQGEPPYSEQSFMFHVYDRQHKEVMSMYCPSSELCLCRGASWHWFRRCHFQAVVYAPVGCIAGFIRRSHTKFIQEFEILSPQEETLLLLRGAPNDLEIYSPDLENELGRLSVHGWRGVMHEIRRTRNDYGITFPLDLDVRVKAVLIGAIFSIDWIYSTKGGKVR
ncbi:hypothetical protein CAPTEDRAFT_219891 [Capitella teleta]|uniref:Phospholipid scramblase n=1 Tax=Capitella teleta TaxID=283909 RepID=R7TF18_CAPTE|nr:hypothetical protein CAPTEDRAFT_219891 [Capitella teleta]|eukprot:ELT89656.1 hypothetical protein CAPTEDRAFT_219891 [Capitella teleta]